MNMSEVDIAILKNLGLGVEFFNLSDKNDRRIAIKTNITPKKLEKIIGEWFTGFTLKYGGKGKYSKLNVYLFENNCY